MPEHSSFNPFVSLCRFLVLLAARRLRFNRSLNGLRLEDEGGAAFTIFRSVFLRRAGHLGAGGGQPGTAVLFRVRFKVAGMTPRQNVRFSVLPIPFFAGLPGFQGKLWALCEETGYFQGLYQWASREAADKYSCSFAMRFMQRRALPGSVSFAVIEGATLESFLGAQRRAPGPDCTQASRGRDTPA